MIEKIAFDEKFPTKDFKVKTEVNLMQLGMKQNEVIDAVNKLAEKKETTILSNCCGTPMQLSQGDERTNCFICKKCNRACDMKAMEIPKNAKLEVAEPKRICTDCDMDCHCYGEETVGCECECTKENGGQKIPCQTVHVNVPEKFMYHNVKLQEATNRAYQKGQENGKKQEQKRIKEWVEKYAGMLRNSVLVSDLLDQLK